MESYKECPICFFNYDNANNRPIVLPWCGHTTCKDCVETRTIKGRLTCALCNQTGELDMQKLIVNYSLMSMLDVQLEPPKQFDMRKAKLAEMCNHKISFIRARKERVQQAALQAENEIVKCEEAIAEFGAWLKEMYEDLEAKSRRMIENARNSNAHKTETQLSQAEDDLNHFTSILNSLKNDHAVTKERDVFQQLKRPMNYNYEVNYRALKLEGEDGLQNASELLDKVKIRKVKLPIEFETFDGFLVSDLEAQFTGGQFEENQIEAELSDLSCEEEEKLDEEKLEEEKLEELSDDASVDTEALSVANLSTVKKKKRRRKRQPTLWGIKAPKCKQQ